MLLKRYSRQRKSTKRYQRKSKERLFFGFFFVALLCFCLGFKGAQYYLVQPQLIFVLGGDEQREKFAAQFAQVNPSLSIWISSGSPQEYVEKIFDKAGIQRDRLHLDYQATDTVTNFTTLVHQFKVDGIDGVYLITSENHMRRARLVGEIVFGSRGIVIKPISVPSQGPPESFDKTLRDGFRALLWLMTGDTGNNFRLRVR